MLRVWASMGGRGPNFLGFAKSLKTPFFFAVCIEGDGSIDVIFEKLLIGVGNERKLRDDDLGNAGSNGDFEKLPDGDDGMILITGSFSHASHREPNEFCFIHGCGTLSSIGLSFLCLHGVTPTSDFFFENNIRFGITYVLEK